MSGVFEYTSTVYYDELDAMNILHNGRFAVHVERAIVAYFHTFGRAWTSEIADNPDQFHAVRSFHIDFLAPVTTVGELNIQIQVEHLGNSSCTYRFHVLETQGTVHASGTRTIVKLDPKSLRPAPWTENFRINRQKILMHKLVG